MPRPTSVAAALQLGVADAVACALVGARSDERHEEKDEHPVRRLYPHQAALCWACDSQSNLNRGQDTLMCLHGTGGCAFGRAVSGVRSTHRTYVHRAKVWFQRTRNEKNDPHGGELLLLVGPVRHPVCLLLVTLSMGRQGGWRRMHVYEDGKSVTKVGQRSMQTIFCWRRGSWNSFWGPRARTHRLLREDAARAAVCTACSPVHEAAR